MFSSRRLSLSRFCCALLGLLVFVGNANAASKDEVTRAAGQGQVTCPSRDFQTFFGIFLENKVVQRAFTKSPLAILEAEQSDELPLFVSSMRKMAFPLFPFSLEKERRSVTYAGVVGKHAEVDMWNSSNEKEASDGWGASYYFDLDDVCWKLAAVVRSAKFPRIPHNNRSNEQKRRLKPNSSCFADFNEFFKVFIKDKEFQNKFTKFPLITRYVDLGGIGGPVRIITVRDPKQGNYSIVPPDFEEKGMKFRIIRLSDNYAGVMVYLPDSGYQIAYYFKKDACWELVFVDDEST